MTEYNLFMLKRKVLCVVPAYNEEKTVYNVLKVLTNSPLINRIVIVNDGSTDNSLSEIKKTKGIEVISYNQNQGKGQAIRTGTKSLAEQIVLFVDSDLIGLKKKHIEEILSPLFKGYADMCVGIPNKFAYSSLLGKFLDFLSFHGPLLSGQRAIFSKYFKKIRDLDLINNYGLELTMNEYCRRRKLRIKKVKLDGVSDNQDIICSKRKKWDNWFSKALKGNIYYLFLHWLKIRRTQF